MLLAMQRAVFIKAMPLRALGATAEQAVEICAAIERRVPELGKTRKAASALFCGAYLQLSVSAAAMHSQIHQLNASRGVLPASLAPPCRPPGAVERHKALQPADCDRAKVHLERGCLALAAWDAIVNADASCSAATESDVTNCIAAGLGMDLSATTRGSGTSATDCTPVRCCL